MLEHPYLLTAGRWAWWVVCLLLPISGGLLPAPLTIALVLLLVPALHRLPVLDRQLLWPLAAYYLLHLLGMVWTSNADAGWFDLQVKLGLLLIPVAAAMAATIMQDLLRRSMIAFTGGLLIAMVLGLYKAWQCHTATGAMTCFSQSGISHDIHPSYAAWYACWAVAYWGMELLGPGAMTRPAKRFTLVAMVLLLLFAVMLASKSGVIGLVVVLLFLLVRAVMRLRGTARVGVIGGGLLASLIALFFGGAVVVERMSASVEALRMLRDGDAGLYSSESGNAMRLVAWQSSLAIFGDAPLGVGTGDVKDALMAQYIDKEATPAAERRLNSHSQFLQGAVALGWPGLIITLLLAWVPLFLGWRRKNSLLILFGLLFLVNALVESVLEVQAGVVFFALFLGVLAMVGEEKGRQQMTRTT